MKKFDNLKSQVLSLNIIIVAAIVLIVLIVLWSIFTGRIGGFSKELQECRDICMAENKCQYPVGVTVPEGEEDCLDKTITSSSRAYIVKFSPQRKVCCVKLE